MRRNRQQGYTMIEILVVIAIMATLLAIGVPSITSQLSHQRLKKTVREVVIELNAARMQSISQNTQYRVEFDLSSSPTLDTFRLAKWTGSAWVDDTTRAVKIFESGADMTSPTADFNVQFYPNGQADATTITIQNEHDTSDQMQITVNGTTGKIEASSI